MTSTDPIANDLLDGAAAIAAYLGWTKSKVYNSKTLPLRKREGVGLYAFRSEIEAWLRDPQTLPENRAA